jgi:hypothetical protein
MDIAPIHSGSSEEEKAIQFMKKKLEEYDLSVIFTGLRHISVTQNTVS